MLTGDITTKFQFCDLDLGDTFSMEATPICGVWMHHGHETSRYPRSTSFANIVITLTPTSEVGVQGISRATPRSWRVPKNIEPVATTDGYHAVEGSQDTETVHVATTMVLRMYHPRKVIVKACEEHLHRELKNLKRRDWKACTRHDNRGHGRLAVSKTANTPSQPQRDAKLPAGAKLNLPK